jgi:threonine dehydrogenase-like Zn-dependent dehydrogenase
MKAICWQDVEELRVQTVDDPKLINPHDAIVEVKCSSACGSDLHLLKGFVPGMREGDIIGHEFAGEVIETGTAVHGLKKGDRVVVSAVIGCGECYFCSSGAWALCDNSNPNPWLSEKMYGQACAGIFGYSHIFGGYAGSHAQYVRVPYADRGAFKIPEPISYEQALLCSDTLPSAYMAAELCGIVPGDIVAVWGCGAVGQLAIRAAWLMGAEKVIAIDGIPYRLEQAKTFGKAEVIDAANEEVPQRLKELTGGRGPDRCIDAVGMSNESSCFNYYYDGKCAENEEEDITLTALQEAIMSCRKGGTIAVAGIYTGFIGTFPIGAAMNKGLRLHMGFVNPQQYIPRLLEHIARGEFETAHLLTHRFGLDAGPDAYKLFSERKDNCMRAVFIPDVV